MNLARATPGSPAAAGPSVEGFAAGRRVATSDLRTHPSRPVPSPRRVSKDLHAHVEQRWRGRCGARAGNARQKRRRCWRSESDRDRGTVRAHAERLTGGARPRRVAGLRQYPISTRSAPLGPMRDSRACRPGPAPAANKSLQTLSFAEWGDIFGDPVMATALLDRLLHHAVVIQIEGASYRLRGHADLAPEDVRANAPIAPPPPKQRSRPFRQRRNDA